MDRFFEDIDFSGKRFNLIVVGIFLVGLFVLALGAGLFFFKNQKGDSDIQILSAQDAVAKEGVAREELVVDIGGAVANPGVYRLSSDLRVNDAIKAAGGLVGGADTSKMNLAAKIGDGQKIYVPSAGQVSGVKYQEASGLISINSATEQELDTLPGIGPVTAKKIIAGRPYSSLNDLLVKKAVSASVFEKIKDLITW
ncbi:MAG: ComEA family DNA-binding protein [Candidatus Curtissbacteria bacterium]|nr:ComEA family DNA-binding protein [Candidatus Curtissbacteria bacterium]